METVNSENKNDKVIIESSKARWQPHTKSERTLGGLIIVGVGAVLLARQMGVNFPEWLFTFEMLLIVIGLYIGVRHSFRGFGWIIPIAIGGLLLIDDVVPDMDLGDYIWPLVIIGAGLFMIFRPRNFDRYGEKWRDKWKSRQAGMDKQSGWHAEDVSSEDKLDSVTVFGGIKKSIISKDFKGGDVVNFFGGAEINLMQADIQGRVVLDVTQVFGGTSLLVPGHWDIKPEMVAVFGGIEDNRMQRPPGAIDPGKILVIRGTSVFGGIEIKSF